MKKIVSLIISSIICISLVGCTDNDNAKDNDNKNTKVQQNKDDSNENETSSESKSNTKTNNAKSTKNNKEKENKDGNIKDGTHLGEEGKKQDEGYVYDPDEDTRDQEYWDSFNEDNNNLNNNSNSNQGGAMDSEDGVKYQYKDEDGNTVKEYENGDKVTEYND